MKTFTQQYAELGSEARKFVREQSIGGRVFHTGEMGDNYWDELLEECPFVMFQDKQGETIQGFVLSLSKNADSLTVQDEAISPDPQPITVPDYFIPPDAWISIASHIQHSIMNRQELIDAICRNFKTFGGDRPDASNPISKVLLGQPPVFALGVPVEDVVDFILKNMEK